MNQTLVTVAIPAYNASAFIGEAINSVLMQSFKEFELILINDGSSDKTLDIMKSFPDPRIRIINDGKRRGFIERLNQSIELARGKYYARMDADDVMHPSRLQRQFDYLESHPDFHLVGSNFLMIDNNSMIQATGFYTKEPKLLDILKNKSFLHPSIMGHLSWFKQHQYDPLYLRIEDKELWLRVCDSVHWGNLEDVLMFYRACGTPVLKKYLLTQWGNMILVSRYRYKIGFYIFSMELLKTVLKIIIYSIASPTHLSNILVKCRGKRIKSETIISYINRVEKVSTESPR